MFARAASGTIVGVDAHEVVVEVHRGKGLPGMALIGLARGAVRESLVRVRSAILASKAQLGTHRLVVNLLPAELPKTGSALDLPLAVALLVSSGTLPASILNQRRFYGELSLGGSLEPVRGAVLMADLARRCGDLELVIPKTNAAEAAVIPGIRAIGVSTLSELIDYLNGHGAIDPSTPQEALSAEPVACLSEVKGQRRVKRALEIAAAGRHNLLMIGPPGSGKTMLAKRLVGLLPPLDAEESIEVTRIHSAAGLLREGGLIRTRPFRAPHHTASEPALCGGGTIPRPGEITLAHKGVLFLDELPEFSRRALESLREPLEEGSIHIARSQCSLTFPADVLLIGAMNPCPCGRYRGDMGHTEKSTKKVGLMPCLCDFEQIQRYRARISGPLLDRIDMHVYVDALPFGEQLRASVEESSASVRQQVTQACSRQTARLGQGKSNTDMSQKQCREHVRLEQASIDLLESAVEKHGLSARAMGRILKVARTIADLASSAPVNLSHIHEAIGLRLLERHHVPDLRLVAHDRR
ncbi:MAG: YifB family Mg chelatase-like AAA ATPase [Myxococcota bacterium]